MALECDGIGGCQPGCAVITMGYNLPASFVIHAIGPNTNDHALLRATYMEILRIAEARGFRSLAFCCISTGMHGFPLVDATDTALRCIREWLDHHSESPLTRIIMAVQSKAEHDVYNRVVPRYFPATTRMPPAAHLTQDPTHLARSTQRWMNNLGLAAQRRSLAGR